MPSPFSLRPYQSAGVHRITAALTRGARPTTRLFASPTGTGKSLVALAAQAAIPGAYVVTPRLAILLGFLDKLGADVPEGASDETVARIGREFGLYTPVRLRNLLADREVFKPSALIVDEGHHFADGGVLDDIARYSDCPVALLTGSPYRGTAAQTKQFWDRWGKPDWLITYPDAVAAGYCSQPSLTVWPLVDDDIITVTNGEFTVESASAVIGSRMDAICERIQAEFPGYCPGMLISVPSVDLAIQFANRLSARVISAATPLSARREAIADCFRADSPIPIVQVATFGEGTDYPFRVLIDCHPMQSPVEFVQQIGRITRPGIQPRYIGTNRNLERHSAQLAGLLPPVGAAMTQRAFGGPTERPGLRVGAGLEAIGKFKRTPLPLADGSWGAVWMVQQLDGNSLVSWAVIHLPDKPEPIVAARLRQGDTYYKWGFAKLPPSFVGYATAPARVTPRQRAAYTKVARRVGLDYTVEPDGRLVNAAFLLADLDIRL